MENEIYEQIRKKVENADVVSFDVFDTLLLRPFSKPSDLFKLIEKHYKKKGFAQKRILAEKTARESHTPEITLDDIYNTMDAYTECKQIELQCEKRFLFPNKRMKEIYDYAVDIGKKIVIVSDMYLSAEVVSEFLEINGFKGYEKLYVSSEYGKTKHSGELFDILIREYPLSTYNILHIGDNVTSDYQNPQKKGIQAIALPKNIDRFFRYRPVRQKDSNTLSGSVFAKLCADRWSDGFEDYWHQFGYEFAGPICYSFTKWIWTKVLEETNPAKSIMFVARDGYLLKEIYKRIQEVYPETNAGNALYVYAPRMVNIVSRLSYDDSFSGFEKKHYVALLEYYDDLLPEYDKTQWTIEDYKKCVSDNLDRLKSAARVEFESYKQYIASLGCADSIFLVDSTTASYSAQSIIERALGKKIKGLYYYQRREDDSYDSETFQMEKYNVLICFPLIEFIMSAPTPSVKTVRAGLPIYHDKNEYEDKRIRIFNSIKRGVLEFADDIIRHHLVDLEISEPEIRRWFNHFCENGRKEDKEAFSEVRFSNDPNHADLMQLKVFTRGNSEMGIRDRIFTWLTLHPKLYGTVRSIYKTLVFYKR